MILIGIKNLPLEIEFPKYNGKIEKPKNLNHMINLACKLTKNINFARVDMYNYKNHIYIGEITFTPGANIEKFNPPKYDEIFGESLLLINKNFL